MEERERQEQTTGENADAEKRPARYSLYDKAKLKIPLKVMDRIIYGLVALLIIAIIVGMIIGN